VAISGLVLNALAGPASAVALPNSADLAQWSSVGAGWINGALGGGYAEGQTVPFHLDVTKAGEGTFSFSVCREYKNGDIFGYLRLAPYNTTIDVASMLTGTITDVADGPDQPFTGVAAVGSVHIDSVLEVGGPGACGALERETQVQITVTGEGGDVEDAYVLWGGRLASPADPGVGGNHGAGQWNGASLAMRLASSAKNMGIKTDAIIQLSTITVQKVVDSGTATADKFCFNISPNPVGVTLPACPAAGTDTVAFVGLPTGNYTVSEAGLAGYAFASGGGTANCGFVGAAAMGSVTNANAPIDATCVFHNLRTGTPTGTLTINQVINPGDDPGRFDMQIDGSTSGTGASVGDGGTTGAVIVPAGAHAVGNSAVTGTDSADYDSSTVCTANDAPVAITGGSVSIAEDQDVICTITLTPKPIIIIDDTDPTPPIPPTSSTTTTTQAPDRCASSRTHPLCGGDNDPVVPEVEGGTVTTTTAAPAVDPAVTVAGGGDPATPAPEVVLAGVEEQPAPAPAGTLPRTGASQIGTELTLAFALLAAGIALLGFRRRPAAQGQEG
jgi:LPXTG-motif cell wall-anchored protein